MKTTHYLSPCLAGPTWVYIFTIIFAPHQVKFAESAPLKPEKNAPPTLVADSTSPSPPTFTQVILYPAQPVKICDLPPIINRQFSKNENYFYIRVTIFFYPLESDSQYQLASFCKPNLWISGKMYLPDVYSGFETQSRDSSSMESFRTYTMFSNKLPSSEKLDLVTPKFCTKKLDVSFSVEVFTHPEEVFTQLDFIFGRKRVN